MTERNRKREKKDREKNVIIVKYLSLRCEKKTKQGTVKPFFKPALMFTKLRKNFVNHYLRH